jgi:hypothetical protein
MAKMSNSSDNVIRFLKPYSYRFGEPKLSVVRHAAVANMSNSGSVIRFLKPYSYRFGEPILSVVRHAAMANMSNSNAQHSKNAIHF